MRVAEALFSVGCQPDARIAVRLVDLRFLIATRRTGAAQVADFKTHGRSGVRKDKQKPANGRENTLGHWKPRSRMAVV